MKIKRVECDQFAGVHDIDVEFEDGLNLVIGENESGKSTLADLIFRILFKDSKLDGRRDEAFINCYFPNKVSGPQGDVIDGTLVFATDKGRYNLTREWEKKRGSSRLTTPEKTVIKNTGEISNILAEELKYGEGVFDEIVFASQRRNQSAIETIMKTQQPKKKEGTRDALVSTLTQAALETGGVSLKKLESKLQEKLSFYTTHWDLEADKPEGGKKRDINNQWKSKGSILEAYYAMEETRQSQIDAENAEKEVEICQKQLKDIQDIKKRLEEQLKEFWNYKGLLVSAALLRDNIARDQEAINKMKEDLRSWPDVEGNLTKAEDLQKQKAFIQIKNRYLEIKKVKDDSEKKERLKDGLIEITRNNVEELEGIMTEKQLAESKISGLNLAARIKQLGELPIEVKSIASGESIHSSDGEYNISGAVEIMIPEVMEMQLIPKGVDVDKILGEISSANEKIQKIFEQYGVATIEELRKKQGEYERVCSICENAQERLQIILNGESWDAIKEEYEKIDIELMTEEELNENIRKLCGEKSIEVYIGGVENTLKNLKKTYVSKEDLSGRISETDSRIGDNKAELEKLNGIPEQYQQIKDPERFEEEITNKVNELEASFRQWNKKCNVAIRGLGERTAEDYTEELLEKEDVFAAKKAEYEHWKHISDVFFCMKEQLIGNPMEDIESNFRKYLSIISEGNIELQNIDETMSANLSSGNNKLAFDILSNGTKDTISLAFRLAMLEHLYPKGGGLAVFDDAFTEMDPKRVKQACKLIEKFAENNQVIFITCDAKYRDLLPKGKVIEMTS